MQDHRIGGGGRELQRVQARLDDLSRRRDLLAAHHAYGDEITHYDRDHEDRADDDAGLCQGNDDVHQSLPAGGPGVIGGFDQPLVDADHRVEDRHHHEEGEEVNERKHHRKLGKQQPLQRVLDQAHALKAPVHQPVATKQRNPRYHADHIRGPERDRAKQREHDLPGLGADVEGEEIGDRKADQKGQHPGQQAQFQGLQIGLQDGAEIRQLGDASLERVAVATQAESRDHFIFVVVPRADDRHEQQRQQKKYREDEHHRRGLKPRNEGFAVLHH